ncbi:tetratricopeptide repeat protein [bacterium]|nr:tetratricopeptide repeat protein [bacterium]
MNAVLLFWLLTRLTGRTALAAVAAALFAVHPLRVESVAWIAERKDVLCVFFSLASMHAWLSYVRRPGAGFYALTTFGFALALMSKPMAVTLPILLLLLDRWPLGRRQILEKVPLIALSAISGWITLNIAHDLAFKPADLGETLARAAVAYAVYLQKTFWPSGLAIFYPAVPVSTAAAASAVFLLIGITAFTLRQLKPRPFLFTGWAWYVVALTPVIGLSTISHADRFTYLPHVGLMIAAVWGAADLLDRRPALRPAAAALAVMAAAGLVFSTRSYVDIWRDNVSLFGNAVRVTRGNEFAHHQLASALVAAGRADEAIPQYRAVIDLNPAHMLAHMNLAMVLDGLGETAEAIRHYEKVLELSPDFSGAHTRLGNALARSGDPARAIPHFERAAELEARKKN